MLGLTCTALSVLRRERTAHEYVVHGYLVAPLICRGCHCHQRRHRYGGIPEPDEDVSGGVPGGTLSYYLTNPVGIEPYTAEENQGVEVVKNLYDTLVTWDWGNKRVEPLAAEGWDVNEDATQFTFYLRKDAKFHNGQPVTSADFKYSWERNCSASTVPAPSSQGYKLNMISGANEMMAGTGDSLDIECPDDYTLVVNLSAPYGDFLMQVCDCSSAPVPAGSATTDEEYQKFRVAPIGNGPFMMDGEWVDGQYISLKRFDDYWGEKPLVDGVTFMVFANDQTAWTEFQAGNLDFTQVPRACSNSPARPTARPRKMATWQTPSTRISVAASFRSTTSCATTTMTS